MGLTTGEAPSRKSTCACHSCGSANPLDSQWVPAFVGTTTLVGSSQLVGGRPMMPASKPSSVPDNRESIFVRTNLAHLEA
jgi:hypothetical protein